MTIGTDELGTDTIVNVAKTSMSSKIIGPEMDYFARIVVDAMTAVKRTNSAGKTKYPVGSVNVLKAHGGMAKESRFIDGYALNLTVSSQMMVKRIDGVKIACLDFNLMKSKMKMGVQVRAPVYACAFVCACVCACESVRASETECVDVRFALALCVFVHPLVAHPVFFRVVLQVLVSDPEKLEAIRKRESDITKERIQKILDAGANVVVTTQGIDDMCLKYAINPPHLHLFLLPISCPPLEGHMSSSKPTISVACPGTLWRLGLWRSAVLISRI